HVAVEVIEEDSADAARFISVRKEKILVAICFHLRVVGHDWMPGAHTFPGLMKTDHVFAEWVVRRQVGAAAEPVEAALGQIAKVHGDRRHERIVRVHHERNSSRGKGATIPGELFGELFRHFAEYFGEIDPAFFESLAVDDDARSPASAALALP